jgi:hypothetical protein
MAQIPDLLEALDSFVRLRKRLLGTDGPVSWVDGHNRFERRTVFPIELDGELLVGARLEVTSVQRGRGQFRLSLCYNAAIARLDHTDETHANTLKKDEVSVPSLVTGPHYHSWQLNRRFFRGLSKAPELGLAEPFASRGNFDSNLRWFCEELNIDQPDGRHVIELPRREGLFDGY